MKVVVADTGPLRYLVLIDAIDVLPRLFGTVIIPDIVHQEMLHEQTPEIVHAWAKKLPPWLNVLPSPQPKDSRLLRLDKGEQAAITLAGSLEANLILMDDRAGVTLSEEMGFLVTGTLGLLGMAASEGFLDLADAFTRLKTTNFRYRQEMLDALLAQYEKSTSS